jgi:hypothetical protein
MTPDDPVEARICAAFGRWLASLESGDLQERQWALEGLPSAVEAAHRDVLYANRTLHYIRQRHQVGV